MLYIGIDCGVHTGVAVWDAGGRKFLSLDTIPIHKALDLVKSLSFDHPVVIIEDARMRKWYTGNVSGKAQGAGSVKRDCKIWEDFCRDNGIAFRLQPPSKGMTKWDAEAFARMTGWKGRTSEHARDAALLVWGRS